MGEAPLPGLSVFLITLNEADRLGETLAAVSGIASEIIVVDSGSTDATVEVARTGGARVIRERWRGYGPQKRFAEEQCAGPWLLNLDADEFVPPALADEIRTLLAQGEPKHVAYKIQIADQLPDATAAQALRLRPEPGAPLPQGCRPLQRQPGARPRRSASPAARSGVCASASTIARRGRCRTTSPRSIPTPMPRSPTWWRAARRIGQWRLLVEMPLWFFKYYVMRRQFIHGFYGFTTSVGAAYGRFLRVAKLIEWQREQARKQRKP